MKSIIKGRQVKQNGKYDDQKYKRKKSEKENQENKQTKKLSKNK